MFTVASDPGAAALRVRLAGHVSIADLNRQAAAMVCESLLSGLGPGSIVVADLARLHSVEREAQGALVFLLQQALRIPGAEVLVVAPPPLLRVLEATFMRRLLQDSRVRVFDRLADADAFARSRSP